MKNLNTLILFFVLILVTGYVYNQTDYTQYQEDNKAIYYVGDCEYSITIQYFSDTTAVAYCNGDTNFILVSTKEEMHDAMNKAIDSLECKSNDI